MMCMHTLKFSRNSISRTVFLFVTSCLIAACASDPSSTRQISKPKIQSAEEVARSEAAMIHTKLARGYMQQEQYATAKSELQKALQINPRHSATHYVMALLMIKLEQFREAEDFFENAVRYDRENSSAAHDYGVFLCQIGKPQKAVPYFETAVANPLFKRAALSYMRAGECLSGSDERNAELYLKKALELNPRLGPALLRLAVLKFDASNYLSARAYIERYFAITEPQPDSLLLAYKIESSLDAADMANSYRSKLLRNFPGSEQARSVRESERP